MNNLLKGKTHIKVALVLILLLGSLIRLNKSDRNFQFEHEQSDDLIMIQDIWRNISTLNFSDLSLKGQIGTYREKGSQKVAANPADNPVYHGVFYYYFLLPASVLGNFDPYRIVLFLILLGIISIYLIYEAAREIFEDEYTALFASLLFSISFWMVAHSRSIWTPSLTPFFVLLSLFGLIKVLKNKWWGWLPLGFGVSAASQIQVSGYFFLAFIILCLFIYRPKLPKSNIKKLFIFIIFSLPLAPSLIYEFSTNFRLFREIFARTGERIIASTGTPTSAYLKDIIDKFSDVFINFGAQTESMRNISLGTLRYNDILILSLAIGTIGTFIALIKKGLFLPIFTNFKKEKILILWFALFFFFPWLVSLYYGEIGGKVAILNHLLVGLPFLIMIFARLVRILINYPFWIPLALALFLGVTYSNVRAIRTRMWSDVSDYNFGLKKDVSHLIGKDISGSYEINFSRAVRTDEIVYLLNLYNYRLPERFNGNTKIAVDEKRVLSGGNVDYRYTIIDLRDKGHLEVGGERIGKFIYLEVYKEKL